LPNVPVLHIVRDGRDVALSLIDAQFGPKTVYAAAKRWRQYLRAIAAIKGSLPKRQLHEIRYEDLLRRPEEVLRGVCEFLGESYSPQLLEFHKDATAYNAYGAEHRNLRNPLMPQNVARWRREMSPAEVGVFESVAARKLVDYGYVLTTPAAPLSELERYYLGIAGLPAKALALLRNRVGHAEELHLMKVRSRVIFGHPLRLLAGKR
jgi:hypothetical protein